MLGSIAAPPKVPPLSQVLKVGPLNQRSRIRRELYEEVVAGESTLLVDESGFAVRLLRVRLTP